MYACRPRARKKIESYIYALYTGKNLHKDAL